ncbi:hypothetical protein [Roseicella frigidaeris]|uniref:Uncharacterized protein n=1 Tax=Roseicella frigidaeris TaxID=2230885 RepID=A0A327MB82_9PROT|nr:hypothetical protein [Roseicella frigidaeris]RAI59612.1 hypothetical protein DOO78_08445 [Roseicella frigidaeris]
MFTRRLPLPALALAALFGGATVPLAADAYPRLSGGDDDQQVTYGPIPGDTIVGGAVAGIEGGGRKQTGYMAAPGGQAREGRIGVLQGGGRDAAVQYLDGRPHLWADTAADTDDRGHGG